MQSINSRRSPCSARWAARLAAGRGSVAVFFPTVAPLPSSKEPSSASAASFPETKPLFSAGTSSFSVGTTSFSAGAGPFSTGADPFSAGVEPVSAMGESLSAASVSEGAFSVAAVAFPLVP